MFLHLLLSRALPSLLAEKACVAARLVRLPPFPPVGRVDLLTVRILSPLRPLLAQLPDTGPLFCIILLILGPVPLFLAVFLKLLPAALGVSRAVGVDPPAGDDWDFLLDLAPESLGFLPPS